MHASVPELQKRTISAQGTASITIFASSFSRAHGAPKDVPLASCSTSASFTSSRAAPQIAGPHEPT